LRPTRRRIAGRNFFRTAAIKTHIF
jgi:hypothetical protein